MKDSHRWAAASMASIMLAALAACSARDDSDTLAGYVEGEWIYLSAPQAGYLQAPEVARGARVEAGQTLFQLSADPDQQALQEAQSRVASAQERLQNLREPRRAPEVAALQAELAAARANLRTAQLRLERQQSLADKGFVSASSLDDLKGARDQAQAQVEAARQQLSAVEASVGRPAEVRGAQADWQAAQAQAAQRRWLLERKTVAAPAAGEITEVYFHAGEWVPAGQPVASLLPYTSRRLRFFVPQARLARLKLGQAVQASCDGCPAPIMAKVNFIAAQAEYTPPVIYSKGNREKLVFRVEAVPGEAQAASLRPGLPVEVRLLEP